MLKKILLILILQCSAVWASTIPSDINKDGTIDLKDVSDLAANWLSEIEPICNFMVIADIHYGNFVPYTWSGSKRQPNGHDRFYSFVSQSNNSEPDFVIQLGDIADQYSIDYLGGIREYAQDVNSLSDDLIYYIVGNHFKYQYDSDNSISTDYFSLMTQTCPANLENIWTLPGDTAGHPWSYTFNIGADFRGVNIYCPSNSLVLTPQSWISQAIDVNEPVIVFTHAKPTNSTLDILSASPNIVALIRGHNHEGSYEEYNGLPIFGLKGSVWTPAFDNFTSNAYYKIDVGWIINGTSKKVYIDIKGFVRGEDFFFVSNKEF